MSEDIFKSTSDIVSRIPDWQGGSFTLSDSDLAAEVEQWRSSVNIPSEYMPFKIFTRDSLDSSEYKAALVMMVNPTDLSSSHTNIFESAYTRRGWATTGWGNQPPVVSVSGFSAGFYYVGKGGRGGLTNFNRKKSPAFLNLMSMIAMYRNHGCHFMDGEENPDLFNTGHSRVINVMDTVGIEYDGTVYEGSFNSFTLTDGADRPYNMQYNFDFTVMRRSGDLENEDGHICRDGNEGQNRVQISIQGFNVNLEERYLMNRERMNRYFQYKGELTKAFGKREEEEEEAYYSEAALKQKENVYKIRGYVLRITRGWRDSENHEGKCDFRATDGEVRSFSNGIVTTVYTSKQYGGYNFIIIRSKLSLPGYGRGKDVFVRYFHMDPNNIQVKKGDQVGVGTLLGYEGTDGGKYPPHCDLEVRSVNPANLNYRGGDRVDVTPLMDANAKKAYDARFVKDRSARMRSVQQSAGGGDVSAESVEAEKLEYKIVFKHGERKTP